jgi:peroxiredoxin Q/BCP
MNVTLISVIIISIALCSIFFCNAQKTLNVGDYAPNFTLKDQYNNNISLTSIPGKKALIFYPKDSSYGCTKQACSIRDGFTELTDAGITVLGISKGSIQSKSLFASRDHLPFTLLSATKNVLKAYGVEGSFFRLYLPKRYTFLINEKGIIVAIIKNIDLNNHAQQIIDEFNKHSQ